MPKKKATAAQQLAEYVRSDPALLKKFDDEYGVGSGVNRTIEQYLRMYADREAIAYYLGQDLGIPDQEFLNSLLE